MTMAFDICQRRFLGHAGLNLTRHKRLVYIEIYTHEYYLLYT